MVRIRRWPAGFVTSAGHGFGGLIRRRCRLGADDEAGDHPHGRIAAVLAAPSRHDARIREEWKLRTRFDVAPTRRLALDVGDKPARWRVAWMAAIGLGAESVRPLVVADGPPIVPAHLEALAEAPPTVASHPADHHLEVGPRRLVGGHDRDPGAHRVQPYAAERPPAGSYLRPPGWCCGCLGRRRDGMGWAAT
jgi:hypothetical protein